VISCLRQDKHLGTMLQVFSNITNSTLYNAPGIAVRHVTTPKVHQCRETDSLSDSKKIPRLLWKVNNRVLNSSLLDWISEVYILAPYAFKIYFNIILPSMSRSPKWSLSFRLSN
jgi:hypothetical protein